MLTKIVLSIELDKLNVWLFSSKNSVSNQTKSKPCMSLEGKNYLLYSQAQAWTKVVQVWDH